MTTTTTTPPAFPLPSKPRGLRALLVALGGLWTRPCAALVGISYPRALALSRALRALHRTAERADWGPEYAREELEAAEALRVRIEALRAAYGRDRVAALVLDLEAAQARGEENFWKSVDRV